MIYKYYHIFWVLSFTCGLFIYRKYFFLKKFDIDINILFFLLLSFLIISFLSLYIIKKFDYKGNILLKTALILSALIFFLAGSARYCLYACAENSNIFNLIYTINENRSAQNLKSMDVSEIVNAAPCDLKLSMEGRVVNYPEFYRGELFFLFEAENIMFSGYTDSCGEKINANDLVLVKVKTKSRQLLKRDEVIKFDGHIKKNNNSMLFITEEARIEKIEPVGLKDRIFFIRGKFYTCLSNIFYCGLNSSFAGLCRAVVLGDTSNLSKNIKQNFIKSGVYHLLAISGLHVSFFVFIISSVLNFLIGCRVKDYNKSNFTKFVLFILILMFLFFYNFLVGCRASIIRSSFMSGTVILAVTVQREHNRKTILSQGFIFTLLLSPEMFSSAGFWLSFGAAAAIIYTNNIYYKLSEILYFHCKRRKYHVLNPESLKIRNNYFVKIIITTFSVNIFIFPVIAFLFKEFSFLSFITNIFVIPLFYVLLAILIFSSAAGLFWPPMAIFLIKSANIPFYLILKITDIWKILDFGVIRIQNFSAAAVTVYYSILLAVLFLLSKFFISRYKSNG